MKTKQPKQIVFTNSEGKKLWLNENLTLEDLCKMMHEIRLTPKNQPTPKGKRHKP